MPTHYKSQISSKNINPTDIPLYKMVCCKNDGQMIGGYDDEDFHTFWML